VLRPAPPPARTPEAEPRRTQRFDTKNAFRETSENFESGLVMRGGAKIGCIGELLVELVCSTKNGRHRRLSTPAPARPPATTPNTAEAPAHRANVCMATTAKRRRPGVTDLL
jgi:hypothetical protein